jgi:hypothetical protein
VICESGQSTQVAFDYQQHKQMDICFEHHRHCADLTRIAFLFMEKDSQHLALFLATILLSSPGARLPLHLFLLLASWRAPYP